MRKSGGISARRVPPSHEFQPRVSSRARARRNLVLSRSKSASSSPANAPGFLDESTGFRFVVVTVQLTVTVEQTEPDFKNHTLPIARIKKVMKSDIDVKPLMISAEAPIMFAKACEIFVEEVVPHPLTQNPADPSRMDACRRKQEAHYSKV